MGTVYRAKHLLIDRAVAVKVLNPRFVEDEAAKARFPPRGPRPPAVCSIPTQSASLISGRLPTGYVYIVIGVARGRLCAFAFERSAVGRGPLSLDHECKWRRRWRRPMDAGIIHRDLKPANISSCNARTFRHWLRCWISHRQGWAADSLRDDI